MRAVTEDPPICDDFGLLGLVRDKKYFVLHAPRQTGKTSALLALAEVLNERGYGCVYATVETARTARDDVTLQRAMRVVLATLARCGECGVGRPVPARRLGGKS